MKVLIDGKEVKRLNDVKIIYENQLLDVKKSGKEIYGDLHITLNSQGMIVETLKGGTVYKTMWEDLDDIVEKTN
jgi:hypothetical protein